MEFVYLDKRIAVCVKPAGVLSTDEPDGMPALVRAALGDEHACVRTVHRLDRVLGVLMVFALSSKAASVLSRQIREGTFQKEYLAVVHGRPEQKTGVMEDLLRRDRAARKTYVVTEMDKNTRPARLSYECLDTRQGLTLVSIRLHTGRTHQIRCQFSSRGVPLVGDRKYGLPEDECDIALWSHKLSFIHPETDEPIEFIQEKPDIYPFTLFDA